MAAVTQDGQALKHAHASLQADREVVTAAVTQKGWALQYAETSFKVDREVVMAAVKESGIALEFADSSLHSDLEVQLVAARHDKATEALALLERLRKLPDWEEQEAMLGRAVELLEVFPQFHDLVDGMIQRAYAPGDRDRAEYENNVFV